MHRSLIAALAVALGGCSELPWPGSDGGASADAGRDAGPTRDGGSRADGGLPLGSACSVLSARRCAYLQRCGLIEGTALAIRECQSYQSATACRASRWPARVDAGTLRFDPQLAQACADGFLGRGCADWESDPEECSQFLSPGSVLAGHCYGQYPECLDSVCRGAACPRTCQLPGVVDEPCSDPADCRSDAGLYCRQLSATPGLGKCTAFGKLGLPCSFELPCGPDLFCNGIGQCEARRKVGEGCKDALCIESAWCHQTPMDGGLCADRLLATQSCTDDVQCRNGLLCEPLLGMCATAGPVPDGGPCSLRQSCTSPNVCVGAGAATLGSCQVAGKSGGSCSSSFDCERHLACASFDGGVDRTCGPRLVNGAPCGLSRDCQAYSRCVNRSCTPLPTPGNPCLAGMCLFGACDPGADGGPQCVDVGGPGAFCLVDGECASNLCHSGRCLASCGP